MDIRAYLSLEAALINRLVKAWKSYAEPIYERIAEHIDNREWYKATALAYELDLTDIARQNREYMKYALLSCAVYGAKTANKTGPVFFEAGTYDTTLNRVVDSTLAYLEHRATMLVQADALQSIAAAEQAAREKEQVVKANPYRDAEGRFASADDAVMTVDEDGGHRLNMDIGGERVGSAYLKYKPNEDRVILWTVGVNPEHRGKGYGSRLLDAAIRTSREKYPGKPIEVDSIEDRLAGALKRRGASQPYAEAPGVFVLKEDMTSADLNTAGKKMPDQGLPKKKKKFKVRKDADGRYLTDFVSFSDKGSEALQLTAALNAHRLAGWGFTAEAEVTGVTEYRLTAVLDGRTSKFCRMIDGRTFKVADARGLITDALTVENPEDLRSVHPWPDQSDAAIAEYEQMSEDQLVELGLHVPPFHPGCRTMMVSVPGTGGGVEAPALEPTLPEPVYTPMQATEDTFAELGIEATPGEVDHWNAYVGMNPVQVLSYMTGKPEIDILNGALKGQAISVSPDGTIGFTLAGDINRKASFDVESILDPYTGKIFLDRADFTGAGPGLAASFMSQLFTSLLDTGKSVGSKALVVATGTAAWEYAKMGFLPDAADWQTIRLQAMDDLTEGKLKQVFDDLSDDQKAVVLNLLNNSNEQALQALVDLPISSKGRSIGEWILRDVQSDFELDLTDSLAVSRAQAYL